MYITLADLLQYTLMLATVISLTFAIAVNNKKK